MAGGSNGAVGHLMINPGQENEYKYSQLVSNVALNKGDILRMYTGSGGGVGNPKERDPDRVMQDVMDGYLSPEAARKVYGLSEEKIREAIAGPQKAATPAPS